MFDPEIDRYLENVVKTLERAGSSATNEASVIHRNYCRDPRDTLKKIATDLRFAHRELEQLAETADELAAGWAPKSR